MRMPYSCLKAHIPLAQSSSFLHPCLGKRCAAQKQTKGVLARPKKWQRQTALHRKAHPNASRACLHGQKSGNAKQPCIVKRTQTLLYRVGRAGRKLPVFGNQTCAPCLKAHIPLAQSSSFLHPCLGKRCAAQKQTKGVLARPKKVATPNSLAS